jgi:hypothetical protein
MASATAAASSACVLSNESSFAENDPPDHGENIEKQLATDPVGSATSVIDDENSMQTTSATPRGASSHIEDPLLSSPPSKSSSGPLNQTHTLATLPSPTRKGDTATTSSTMKMGAWSTTSSFSPTTTYNNMPAIFAGEETKKTVWNEAKGNPPLKPTKPNTSIPSDTQAFRVTLSRRLQLQRSSMIKQCKRVYEAETPTQPYRENPLDSQSECLTRSDGRVQLLVPTRSERAGNINRALKQASMRPGASESKSENANAETTKKHYTSCSVLPINIVMEKEEVIDFLVQHSGAGLAVEEIKTALHVCCRNEKISFKLADLMLQQGMQVTACNDPRCVGNKAESGETCLDIFMHLCQDPTLVVRLKAETTQAMVVAAITEWQQENNLPGNLHLKTATIVESRDGHIVARAQTRLKEHNQLDVYVNALSKKQSKTLGAFSATLIGSRGSTHEWCHTCNKQHSPFSSECTWDPKAFDEPIAIVQQRQGRPVWVDSKAAMELFQSLVKPSLKENPSRTQWQYVQVRNDSGCDLPDIVQLQISAIVEKACELYRPDMAREFEQSSRLRRLIYPYYGTFRPGPHSPILRKGPYVRFYLPPGDYGLDAIETRLKALQTELSCDLQITLFDDDCVQRDTCTDCGGSADHSCCPVQAKACNGPSLATFATAVNNPKLNMNAGSGKESDHCRIYRVYGTCPFGTACPRNHGDGRREGCIRAFHGNCDRANCPYEHRPNPKRNQSQPSTKSTPPNQPGGKGGNQQRDNDNVWVVARSSNGHKGKPSQPALKTHGANKPIAINATAANAQAMQVDNPPATPVPTPNKMDKPIAIKATAANAQNTKPVTTPKRKKYDETETTTIEHLFKRASDPQDKPTAKVLTEAVKRHDTQEKAARVTNAERYADSRQVWAEEEDSDADEEAKQVNTAEEDAEEQQQNNNDCNKASHSQSGQSTSKGGPHHEG